MTELTANNKRIAKNTIFLYVRMLFLMLVSLYTSRVVLDKLGVEDFGIYNVVAGFVGMLGFFSSSLSNVTQRFITIELGRGDTKKARQIFNQHQLLYFLIIVLVIIVGETIGLYFVKAKLVIPAERLNSALWAYHFALVSLSFTLFGIVYNSAIIAHEDMKVYSYVGVCEGIARLAIALVISIVSYDRLIIYAALLMLVVAAAQVYYYHFCRRKYNECSFMWFWDRTTIMQTVSFVSWNFFSTIIYMLKGQGLNVLLNIFCGPVVNAARAISFQVDSAISSFNGNFVTSVQPQLVKSYASGDYDYMIKLFFSSSRYSLFLMWVLCFPVMMNIDELLGIWLKEVPIDTDVFTIWVLIDSMLATMTNAPWIITMATGHIRDYVLYSNSILLLIFPFAYFALYIGFAPLSVFVITVIVRAFQIFSILLLVNREIHFGLKLYFLNVLWPLTKIIMFSLTMAMIFFLILPEIKLLNFVLVFIISVLFVWKFGLTQGERGIALNFLKNKF